MRNWEKGRGFMKMSLVLLLCVMLLFSGCARVDNSADTTLPTTESTAPAETDHEWLTDPVEYLSYEKFLSEERSLTRIANVP